MGADMLDPAMPNASVAAYPVRFAFLGHMTPFRLKKEPPTLENSGDSCDITIGYFGLYRTSAFPFRRGRLVVLGGSDGDTSGPFPFLPKRGP